MTAAFSGSGRAVAVVARLFDPSEPLGFMFTVNVWLAGVKKLSELMLLDCPLLLSFGIDGSVVVELLLFAGVSVAVLPLSVFVVDSLMLAMSAASSEEPVSAVA